MDVATVVEASQALSSEIVLPRLIEKLMRLAVEHAGADRGLLILLRGGEPQIEAEASTGHDRVDVTVRRTAITPSDLPQSALHHVIRTRERLVLDDASVSGSYSEDDYVRRQRPRSVLCLPIVKLANLVGALYLESRSTPSAFTSDRVAALELLVSQAAISLENANLYSDLQSSAAAIRASEQSLRRILDTIPGFVCTLSAAGEVELLNRQVLDYFGKTAEDLKNWASSDAVHPDDLPHVIDAWRRSVETGQPYENEHRERRADGAYRWFHSRALPARDTEGRITGWYMLLTDIDDRKRADDELCRSKAYLTEAQRLSRTGSFGCKVSSGEMSWSEETFRIFGYERATTPSLEAIVERVHPEDRVRVQQQIQRATSEGKGCDLEYRLLLPDDSVKHVHVVAHASKDEPGQFEFVGAVMDVTAAKDAEERIRQDERELRTTIETIPAIVSSTLPDGTVHSISERWLDYVGLSREEILGGGWKSTIHPEDLDKALNNWQAALASGRPLEMEARYRRADGEYRWFLVRSVPLRGEKGEIVKWYATVFDIEDRKHAEVKLRQDEQELRGIVDAITQTIVVLSPDGKGLYANRPLLDYTGLTLEQLMTPDIRGNPSFFHPEDWARLQDERREGLSRGEPFELEWRLRRKDGQYRWFLVRYHPLRDEQGRILRWYASGTDIDDRKRVEERTRNENLALREDIVHSSMFEEIVGSSAPLQRVLEQVAKVARTDSTVLVLGETGTGKELIARAIHKGSGRSSRAFIRVNCAAIPQSLIASELFGHERGAFTGALQRRLGRFEAADGGTIFLDEIGDLPAETQVSLLRVLQEREIERVGSSHPIAVDVRVLAATNRDLETAVEHGSLRQDLYYRLNVFPIQVPPLRERADDIPVLVEYLVERYAKKAGKSIRNIQKQTLALFQAYDWPGNVRELQNVIERAVVLCDGDTFSIDESWLKCDSPRSSKQGGRLSTTLADAEKEMIEGALAATHGRISGPAGAATKLGIPRQTLESKIKALHIDKLAFRAR